MQRDRRDGAARDGCARADRDLARTFALPKPVSPARTEQRACRLFQIDDCAFVRVVGGSFGFDVGVANQLEFSKAVIEDEQHARDHENHFRDFQIVARMHRNGRLEKTDDVVADVADRTADKMGNIARCDEIKL